MLRDIGGRSTLRCDRGCELRRRCSTRRACQGRNWFFVQPLRSRVRASFAGSSALRLDRVRSSAYTRRIMLSNRSMPRSTVLPELAYPEIGQAIERLCETFGFTLRIRIGDHRAQLNVGDGAVILIEVNGNVSLKTAVMVRVNDVNAHYERARRYGVHIVREPTDYPYGERQYTPTQPFDDSRCPSDALFVAIF